jgi:hypothetical protein
MRSARFGLLVFILLLNFPVWAQQTPTPTTSSPDQTATTPSPALKDPQAVSVLNQALTAAGGATAIKTVTDYTATGNVTYHTAHDVNGTITIRGNGLEQLRVDANLPSGVRSEVESLGSTSIKAEDGQVGGASFQPPMNPGRFVLPYLIFTTALNSPYYSVAYNGITQEDGYSVHDLRIQFVRPGLADPDWRFQAYHTIDFFIDTSTLQVRMSQEIVPSHNVRKIRYSSYASVNSLLVPFSIREEVAGVERSAIQLTQISLSNGLQDSDFQF